MPAKPYTGLTFRPFQWAPEELPPSVTGATSKQAGWSGPGEVAAQADITIVGTGPGRWCHLTLEVADLLMQAERIYMRHPTGEIYETLKQRGKHVLLLAPLYFTGLSYQDIYHTIADIVVKAATRYGPVVYALPGNPVVFEITPFLIAHQAQQAGRTFQVIEGMSSLECMFVQLGLDPRAGLQVLNMDQVLANHDVATWMHTLLFHIGAPLAGFLKGGRPLEQVRAWLLKRYPETHPVVVVKPSDTSFRQLSLPTTAGRLLELDAEVDILSTLYVPPL